MDGVVGSVKKKKIGVLVVAYNAASTLAKVLDRIPAEIRPDIEEVIVSDDHSQDSTYSGRARISAAVRSSDHADPAAHQPRLWG